MITIFKWLLCYCCCHPLFSDIHDFRLAAFLCAFTKIKLIFLLFFNLIDSIDAEREKCLNHHLINHLSSSYRYRAPE